MANVRVYELSRELGLSNKEIMDIAKNIGISVRSHASSVSEEEARKIKDRVLVSKNHGHPSSQEEVKETKEEIKVFRSESGQEVVERRKGSTVIIRKKKRVEEPELEEESAPAVEEAKETALPVSQEPDLLPEAVEYKVEKHEEPEKLPVEKEVISIEKAPEPEPLVTKPEGGVESIEQNKEGLKVEEEEPKEAVKEEKEEEGKVLKKKGRKVRPKREEIIDEETLEELRRAFRTKLPGRKREYLVEDRRLRAKPSTDGSLYKKAASEHSQKGRPLKTAELTAIGAESAQVIPFPAKPVKRTIRIGESVNVGELARSMGIKIGDVIKKLMSLGAKVTVNQSIDHETAAIVAGEYGFEVSVDMFEEKKLLSKQEPNVRDELLPRPPVVTVMGHVDHGKTTLLDAIRHTNVVEKEAGGITQHIGAYSVSVDGRKVVFIDTPGHEAFTAMRARGAQVTDIVILVVAADDGVMPQTIEAINHAKAAGVPIVVAINKVDKPEANPDRIRRQLSEVGLVPEEWGGDTLFAEVSAKRKTGINELLELVLLQADVLELKANPYKRANGVVIEAKLDKGRGPVATVVVKEGTLRIGDYVVVERAYGRVRALIDDKGNRVSEAGPSMPVEVMGLSSVPSAGELFHVVKDEKTAKELVSYREAKERKRVAAKQTRLSLEDLFESLEKGETKELPLIIKGDTQGSVEALKEAITKLSTEKCRVKIVHAGVGAINETDVVLASASNAVVVGFNVRPDAKALEAAERENVSLELHTIIYDAVDRIKKAMEGLLEPVIKERVIGHAEVKATFHVSKMGTIAGCLVTDGKVVRGHNVRVVRDGVVVFDGRISSLKRFKEDVREVQSGYECGIGIENFNDIKVGDTFEVYAFEEIKQSL
ncbi:MAG TPA: translation initiation factor IF-2 [Thermodesulfobacteriota bacterium]|nr:translation initiation factor IF-2 [Thermodesulfobacteriota bacterium]